MSGIKLKTALQEAEEQVLQEQKLLDELETRFKIEFNKITTESSYEEVKAFERFCNGYKRGEYHPGQRKELDKMIPGIHSLIKSQKEQLRAAVEAFEEIKKREEAKK